jgi:HTH-type transcriptional regulator/antitoxin HigA
MESMKYKIISNSEQYFDYCNQLEALLSNLSESKEINDEIDLLTLLIEKWDNENSIANSSLNPIELLKSFMIDFNMKPVDLAKILNLSRGNISDILNYRKELSKKSIQILSEKFSVDQEAFNRPYELHNKENISNTSIADNKNEFSSLRPSSRKDAVEFLRITSKSISMRVKAFRLIDKKTNETIFIIPSIKIIAKGKDDKTAKEALDEISKKFSRDLTTLSIGKRTALLNSLGWKRDVLKTKNYSKLFVNEKGELKNLTSDLDVDYDNVKELDFISA